MPSENLHWETILALKKSSIGKHALGPFWLQKGESILAGCEEVLRLSPQSGRILDRLDPLSIQNASFVDYSQNDPESIPSEETPVSSASPSLKNVIDLTATASPEDETPNLDDGEVSSPTISLLSPKAMVTAGRIIQFRNARRKQAMLTLRNFQENQEHMVVSLAKAESEQLKRFEELMELKQRQELQNMKDMMERETKESIGRQEKLKEEQRHRLKVLSLRVRELEQQRVREMEQERQRQTEGRDRLRNLNSIQEQILQLNQQLEPSNRTNLPAASLSSYTIRGNQLCSQVSEVVRTKAEGEFPSVEDLGMAERALDEMKTLIQQMLVEVASIQETARKEQEAEAMLREQEKLAAQEEAKRKAEELAKEKAKRKGLQNSAEDDTLKWYEDLQNSAARCTEGFQQINTPANQQMKKMKLDLQKAATIPVSQISSNSGSQLREIFDRIDKLLSGRPVLCSGVSISTSIHPQSLNFVSYKLAEKFVKQGEEEVASHHEAAFPIAVVASGIWELHPQVGDLILAHLHKKCPYTIPNYPPMKEGMSVEDYQRILGFRVDDSGLEGQDSFLKRMSGMIRLYAAIIQLKWPYSSKQGPSPHGLNHGWRWLAQMLNMEPVSDITATLLFDFLEVCGNALMKQYQMQFWKLLLLLRDEYFPRIEAVTVTGQMGSVSRLQRFLEASLRSRHISPPKGQLNSTFWRS